MIIIRLQLAVYNSGNVQVKRREDFSRLGATSASLTIKYNVKHIFSYNKMDRKIPVFVKGGAPKNNTDTSHGISVFSYGENPTEFFCIVCLVPFFIEFQFVIKLLLTKKTSFKERFYDSWKNISQQT
jgi:hypothetical protein